MNSVTQQPTIQYPVLYKSMDDRIIINTIMDVQMQLMTATDAVSTPCFILHISDDFETVECIVSPLDNCNLIGKATWSTQGTLGLHCSETYTVEMDATDDDKIEMLIDDPKYTVFSVHSVLSTQAPTYVHSIGVTIKRIWELQSSARSKLVDGQLAEHMTSVNTYIDTLIRLLINNKDVLMSEPVQALKVKSDSCAKLIVDQVLAGTETVDSGIVEILRLLTPSSEYGTGLMALGVSPDWIWCNFNLTSSTIHAILLQPTAKLAITTFQDIADTLLNKMMVAIDDLTVKEVETTVEQ